MLALYVEDPSPAGMTLEKIRRTLDAYARDPVRGVVVVMEREGAPAGYALVASFWSNELGGEIAVVDELWVERAHRGHGVATWFVRALAAGEVPWFNGAVALELEVTPTNARARALYERLGFQPKKNATLRLVRAPGSS